MATKWIHRLWITVPIADQVRTNQLLAAIDPEPESRGGIDIEVGPTEDGVATHVSTDTPMTTEMLTKFRDVVANWAREGLSEAPRFCRAGHDRLQLSESNIDAIGIGQRWDLTKSLEKSRLVVMRVEDVIGVGEQPVVIPR